MAESIHGYLCAQSDRGAEVRRPARRGVAYRMLKEFGEGNVCLVMRESFSELVSSMAQRALKLGDVNAGRGPAWRAVWPRRLWACGGIAVLVIPLHV